MIERLRTTLLGQKMPPPEDLARDSIPRDVVLRRGGLVPRIGGLLAGIGHSAGAVTLRKTIVVAPGVRLTSRLLAHELTHVRQWERDPLFPLRYSLATLRHGYRNNPYEVEAREVEASVADAQPVEDRTAWRWKDPS